MTAVAKRPDVDAVLRCLKDFQRSSVDYVFRRMFTDPEPTRRFLIADEVGLGKTLVARGVIARAVDHLWDQVQRLDVIYICSNAEIARQNVARLGLGGENHTEFELASRLTLLPIQLHDLKKRKLNFVSLTPGTSFELKSSLGWSKERVLLYWLLQEAWGLKGTGPMNVLQGSTARDRFRDRVQSFKRKEKIDATLHEEFLRSLERHDAAHRARGETELSDQFGELCERFHYSRIDLPEEDRDLRRSVVGDLRDILAATCIEALEPDLIILDEFQRFKQLLDGDHEAARLARVLFEYSGMDSRAHVLLLSATPYKMYTLADEAESEDHYEDFIRTLRFLLPDPADTARMEALLTTYRQELLRLPSGGSERLTETKRELEGRLRRVMVRTERLAVSEDRDGMLTEVRASSVTLEAREAGAYRALQAVARELGHGDTLEYWKAAPYLLNFMDGYKLKQKFSSACGDGGGRVPLAEAIRREPTLFLTSPAVQGYRPVDPANARLRWLLGDTIERGAWKLLWIPPSLPYCAPEGPYAEEGLRDFTKRLVFSGWRVAPKVIASLLSYEAERSMIQHSEPDAENTAEARQRRRGLLRFSFSEGRPVGMPVLAMLYPSLALAEVGDPLPLAFDSDGRWAPPSLAHVVARTQERLGSMLEPLRALAGDRGPADESWYWAAPILLDLQANQRATRSWWDSQELASEWAGGDLEDREGDDPRGWARHVDRARRMLDAERDLGPMPMDLVEVLAWMAVGGPGVTSLRALTRSLGLGVSTHASLRTEAGKVAWGFRSLFNLPETMALLRGVDPGEPYWLQVLQYCACGNLQAVLDEYAHVLRESLGHLDDDPAEAAGHLADEMAKALSLRTVNIGYDDVSLAASGRVEISPRRMRARFALRFGGERVDDATEQTRPEQVRTAFNSPFWPFVLATTSVGQEGLDFHPYCHAVVHWNLPHNPVDLEQREGRVHRYKGHAVRKNLAQRHAGALNGQRVTDPWQDLFDRAVSERSPECNDLQPFWVYPLKNGARIERHVPMLPLSRDEQLLAALRRSLGSAGLGLASGVTEDPTPAGETPALVRRGACLVGVVRVRTGPTPRPVTEGNCVLVRGGGEQPEVNRRSVG
jgi:hypothetical protein